MQSKDILKLAEEIKSYYKTNDPYIIARNLGITVMERTVSIKDFTAQTIKFEGYPTIISINDIYTDFSKKLLCAHELGHALMHENCINHFSITSNNVSNNVEQEANLFAIALLTDEEWHEQLSVPLVKMSNYLLKSIMDYNLEVK